MMRTAGKVNSLILRELKNIIKPGISTMDIDQFVEKTVKEHGMIASEKGYCDYPASACVSVNEEVVHGIPSKKRICRKEILSVSIWSSSTKAIWLTPQELTASAKSAQKQSA